MSDTSALVVFSDPIWKAMNDEAMRPLDGQRVEPAKLEGLRRNVEVARKNMLLETKSHSD